MTQRAVQAEGGDGALNLRGADGKKFRIRRIDPPDECMDLEIPGVEHDLSEGERAVILGKMRIQLRVGRERAVMRAADLVRGKDGFTVRTFAFVASGSELTLVADRDLPAVREFVRWLGEEKRAPDGVPGLIFHLFELLAERYHAASEELVEAAERVAQRVLVGPAKGLGDATFRVRRDAYALRLAVTRARAVFSVLVHEKPEAWSGRSQDLFRELLDRLEPIHEDIENVRESLGETVEAYSSVQANDINEVMKLLTLLSLLFLPPTLIASIYGMNFHIPEYQWANGYAYSLSLMAMLTGTLLLYARMRRWLR